MVEQIQALLGQSDFWLGFILGVVLAGGNLLFMRRLLRRGLAGGSAAAGSVRGRFLWGYLGKQIILVGAAAALVLVVRINAIGLASGWMLGHFALRGLLITASKGTRHGTGT